VVNDSLPCIGTLGVAIQGGNHRSLGYGLSELGHGLSIDVLLCFPERA
jgi:hypothetical protein